MRTEENILVKLKNAGIKQNDKWLVKGVSLEVEKGKIVTLIGPNGSGKSTTAKIALGIYKEFEGTVEKFTNKIGYVPQKISIDWTLPLRVADFMVLTDDLDKGDINEALALTGVDHLIDKRNNYHNFFIASLTYKSNKLIEKKLYLYHKNTPSKMTNKLPQKHLLSVTEMLSSTRGRIYQADLLASRYLSKGDHFSKSEQSVINLYAKQSIPLDTVSWHKKNSVTLYF